MYSVLYFEVWTELYLSTGKFCYCNKIFLSKIAASVQQRLVCSSSNSVESYEDLLNIYETF